MEFFEINGQINGHQAIPRGEVQMRGGCACVCACLRAGLPGNAIQAWKGYSNDDDKNTKYNNRTG